MGEALITRRDSGPKEEFREYINSSTNGVYVSIPEGTDNATFFKPNTLYKVVVTYVSGDATHYGFGFLIPGLNASTGTGITFYRSGGNLFWNNNVNQFRLTRNRTSSVFQLLDYNNAEYRWWGAVVRFIKCDI